jgi:hypothetical protein
MYGHKGATLATIFAGTSVSSFLNTGWVLLALVTLAAVLMALWRMMPRAEG